MDREDIIIHSIIEKIISQRFTIKDYLKKDVCCIAINENRHKKLKNKYISLEIKIKDFKEKDNGK